MKNIICFAHSVLQQRLICASLVVDATMGQGYDTLFLAQNSPENTRIYSFDIQSVALEKTQWLLQQNRQQEKVKLILDGHENITDYISQPIDAVIFNLGYLPNGNKQICTDAAKVIIAIQKIMLRLTRNGLIVLVLYPGHAAGKIEQQQLEQFVSNIPQQHYDVLRYQFINRAVDAPYALILQKIN